MASLPFLTFCNVCDALVNKSKVSEKVQLMKQYIQGSEKLFIVVYVIQSLYFCFFAFRFIIT